MNRNYCVMSILLSGFLFFLSQTLTTAQVSSDQPTTQSVSQDQDLESELRDKVAAQLQAYHEENLEQLFKDVDPNAVGQQRRRQMLQQAFEVFDLNCSLDEFKLLFHDQDLAVARLRRTVKGTGSQPFKNNEVESLQAFRHHEGQWKIFDEIVLEMKLLDEPQTQPTTQPATQPAGQPATQEVTTQPAEETPQQEE